MSTTRKGQNEASRCFKYCGSQDSHKLGFQGTWSPTTRWCRLEGGHALPCHTYVIPEEADLKDVVSLAYGGTLGPNSPLSGTDEGDASGDVSDEPKQNNTNSKSKVTSGISHFVLQCGN